MSEFKAPNRFIRNDFDWYDGNHIRKGSAVKLKKFADSYLETGDATKSAISAGYSAKSARQKGNQLLRNEKVKEYIVLAQKELDMKSIANASEILQFFTAVMRGEVNDQFDLEPSLADRIKAGVELAKRLCDIQQTKPRVVIVNNIPNSSDMEYQKAKALGKVRKRGRPRKNIIIDEDDEDDIIDADYTDVDDE